MKGEYPGSMARAPRIHIPGAWYHVTARGNERRAIFRAQGDYAQMIGILEQTIARFGLRAMLIAGLAPIVAGFALLTRLPAAGSYPLHLLPTMLLIGGFGLAFPAIITLAMSAASPEDAGVASGLVNTTQQVGAALGVAVLSTLAASRTSHLLASGRPAAEALTGGYHVAFAVGAALAAAALMLAAILLRPSDRPAAEAEAAVRTAEAEAARTAEAEAVPAAEAKAEAEAAQVTVLRTP